MFHARSIAARGLGRVLAVLGLLWVAPAFAQPPAAPVETKSSGKEIGPDGPLAGVKALRNLEYAKPDGKPLALDLYVPASAAKPTPLVIWIHGGGWQGGDKQFCPPLPLAKEGFAVASIDYRLTDRACFPAQIHDCKAAVRFLRAHAKEYNLDPERFGCWGASAGGHLVALLGTSCGNTECEGAELGNAAESSAVQCVCDWFGPTDFTEYKAESADVAPMLVKLFGGRMSEKQELVKLASPALHVKKGAQGRAVPPPFLIVQGDKDPLVPDQQSRELAEKLKEAGVSAELVIVEGAGHGFGGAQGTAELKRVREFFVSHLKPAQGGPEKSTTELPKP